MTLVIARQVLAGALAAGLAFAPAVSSAQSAPQQAVQKSERYRVVLQVSDADPAKWNLALNNARNVQEDLGKGNVDVEIVAYGPGLNMLKSDSKVADRLAQARRLGLHSPLARLRAGRAPRGRCPPAACPPPRARPWMLRSHPVARAGGS